MDRFVDLVMATFDFVVSFAVGSSAAGRLCDTEGRRKERKRGEVERKEKQKGPKKKGNAQ